MDSLQPLDLQLGELLAGTSRQKISQLSTQIGRDMRQRERQRITAQQNTDGSAFPPRKPQPPRFREKQGRIRRKMFTKLKSDKYLKMRRAQQGEGQAVEVGFFSGRIARIARVHQYGLRDRPRKGVREVQYPRRELVGFSKDDEAFILDSVVKFLQSA